MTNSFTSYSTTFKKVRLAQFIIDIPLEFSTLLRPQLIPTPPPPRPFPPIPTLPLIILHPPKTHTPSLIQHILAPVKPHALPRRRAARARRIHNRRPRSQRRLRLRIAVHARQRQPRVRAADGRLVVDCCGSQRAGARIEA